MELNFVFPGKTLTQGATVYADGINFTVFSRDASSVTLCIFEKPDSDSPVLSLKLDDSYKTGNLYSVFLKGFKAGTLYLYKVDGEFRPEEGKWFDNRRYLFDPYAKAFTDEKLFQNVQPGIRICPTDKMPKCVVVDDNSYDWEGDRLLKIPDEKTIIYEAHLKGFTAGDKTLKYSGTYRGLIEKIPYLQQLGITAVELLPVMEFDETETGNVNPRTGQRLSNYWGYSTIGFFAPKVGYAYDKTPGACVNEFKDMVKALHKAGIEVLLDVVFNHTAEGNEHGVNLNFRGFANDVYYHLIPEHKEYYANFSGCGNAINCNHPVVREFIINCLRYWVSEMHVDGFLFDLAAVLTRSQHGMLLKFPPITNQISEDPVLASAKIIAEPWDCAGGYMVGNFPGGRWCEWNDKYRDGIRRFIRGDEFTSTEAATRISGSSDLYSMRQKGPHTSINFINAHDGFTLRDLVSYNGKHNEENGEGNRDGSDNNFSYNYGFEGECSNPKINRLRWRQIKNFFVTLMVSQGTPMFVSGDEVCRTQSGNNNAYCQDNELGWFNWNDIASHGEMLDFVKKLIEMRKSSILFQRNRYFTGEKNSEGYQDITWFNWDGANPDWSKINRFLAFCLGGEFYIAMNTDIHDKTITLPHCQNGKKWYRLVDTSIEDRTSAMKINEEAELNSQDRYVLLSNSSIILRCK